MSGGLMQLVAIGAQDMYLTYNSEITFFDTAHKTYTNFAIESMEQLFGGSLDFGKQATANLNRTGDLVHSMYLQFDLPALTPAMFGLTGTGATPAWTNSIGHAIINEVTILIAGVPIDKHYGRWLAIWDELTCKEEHREGMNEMIGRSRLNSGLAGNADTETTLYVPLQFWFNRHVGASLPLVALQFHDVQIKVSLHELNRLVVYLDAAGERYKPGAGAADLKVPDNACSLRNCSIFVDYIYLDNEERTRFASEDHMYLCEQLQYHGEESISSFGSASEKNIKLSFNHPVKELVWTVQNNDAFKEGPSYNDWFNFSSGKAGEDNTGLTKDLLGTAQIRLNTHDRFTPARAAQYFRLVQPANHHTRIPSKNIYVYSFALNPEEYQPSGTCNFSRIDNVHLILKTAEPSKLPNAATAFGAPVTSWADVQGRAQVYALSLNQLKISGGLGGLQYAN